MDHIFNSFFYVYQRVSSLDTLPIFAPPHSATRPSWRAPRDERRWPSKTSAGSAWCRRPVRATGHGGCTGHSLVFWVGKINTNKLSNRFKKESRSEVKLPISTIPSAIGTIYIYLYSIVSLNFIGASLLEPLSCLVSFFKRYRSRNPSCLVFAP